VAIAIQGLSPGISSPLDFVKPVIRTYHNNDHDQGYTVRGPAVQHIDVKTSWNFSNYAEAQELCRIHQAFTITLERMLASELWNVYLQDCIPKVGEDEGCLTAEVVRGISFCREQLVGDMADSLYSTQEDMRVRAQLGLIRLYLAASDCLVQYEGTHSRDTSITVRVYHNARSQALYPFVQAAWIPDSIVFENLDGIRFLREGQQFSIVPRYQCNSPFASTRYPTAVRYSIESQYTPLSWLTWDDHIAGFKGIVPMYSATQTGGHHWSFFAPVGSLYIVFKAVIVEDAGFFVHFERTVRARLTIDILPWDDNLGPSPCQGTGSNPTQYGCNAQGVDRIVPSVAMSSVSHLSFSQIYDDRQSIFSREHETGRISSTAKPEVKAVKLPKLAQEHAHLAAKYADISQRLADTEKHVRSLDTLGGYGWAQTQRQQPNLQVYSAGYHGSAPLSSRTDTGLPIARGPSASSHISEYALDHRTPRLRGLPYQTALRSPRLNGRANVQDHIIETSSNVRFPALPPPAVRSAPSQTFNDITQAWTRMYSPQITPTRRSHRSRSDTRQGTPSPQHRPTSRSLGKIPNADCYLPRGPMGQDTGALRSADATQLPATPIVSTSDGAKLANSEEGSRKRHARPSPSSVFPSKPPKENENCSQTPALWLGMAPYNCYSPPPNDMGSTLNGTGLREASFSDLPNQAGRSEGDASIHMRRRMRSSHPGTDSYYHLDLQNVESEAQPLRILADPVQFPHGVPTPPDSLNGITSAVSDPETEGQKPWEYECGQEGPGKMYTSSQTFYPGERFVSVHSWQASSTFSRAASSNIEVTLQDPRERTGHREQAKVWHRLFESESSDKENKPGAAGAETRLSEDERKAIQEAIERSVNDMTEDLHGIFLNDSDDMASGDETTASDEL